MSDPRLLRVAVTSPLQTSCTTRPAMVPRSAQIALSQLAQTPPLFSCPTPQPATPSTANPNVVRWFHTPPNRSPGTAVPRQMDVVTGFRAGARPQVQVARGRYLRRPPRSHAATHVKTEISPKAIIASTRINVARCVPAHRPHGGVQGSGHTQKTLSINLEEVSCASPAFTSGAAHQ